MENCAREVIVIGNQYHSYENFFDVSSECVLTQNDMTGSIEDVQLHANILTHESDVSCPNQHDLFTPITAFDGDFESLFDSSVHHFMNNRSAENEIMQEVVVEEVAELEIISDSLICESPNHSNTHEDREKPSPSRIDSRQQCDICYRKFYKKSSLLRHSLYYHSEIPTYECFECGKLFARKIILIKHLQQHKKNQETEFNGIVESRVDSIYFKCERNQCSKLSRGTRRSHRRRADVTELPSESLKSDFGDVSIRNKRISNDFSSCESSPKTCLIENRLEASKRCESSDNMYSQRMMVNLAHREALNEPICDQYETNTSKNIYCDTTCGNFSEQQKHISDHSGSEFVMRNVGEKKSCTRTKLKRRTYSHRDKSISCSECDDKRPNDRTLATHSGSSSARIFPCHACDKIFSSKSSQQIHARIHTGERPYKCRFCVKAFADGGTLRKHERIHTGEKPYICPICAKAFNQRVVVREHIRVHHVKFYQHYKCEVCSMTFDTSQELCFHLVKHSDDNTAKHRALSIRPRKYKKISVFAETYVATES